MAGDSTQKRLTVPNKLTVLILGLSPDFGQFDKLIASKFRSLAGKPHLSDNLEQSNLTLHPHHTQDVQIIYNILRLRRSQPENVKPRLPRITALGTGVRTILALPMVEKSLLINSPLASIPVRVPEPVMVPYG